MEVTCMNPEPFASIAVLCTDDRQRAAADALCRRGYVVERLIPGESDPLLLAQTDFLLLPVLVEPALLPLLAQCRRGTVLLCGRVTDELHQLAKRRSLLLHSYLQQEEMALLTTQLDALLTDCGDVTRALAGSTVTRSAEAAIELALSQLPITLWESRCLLTGFGRCANPLARLLTVFGAQLTVCARSPKDLALARSFGLTALPLAQMDTLLPQQQLIFNTVPAPILGKEQLRLLPHDCLLIDLASGAGGIDHHARWDFAACTPLPCLPKQRLSPQGTSCATLSYR